MPQDYLRGCVDAVREVGAPQWTTLEPASRTEVAVRRSVAHISGPESPVRSPCANLMLPRRRRATSFEGLTRQLSNFREEVRRLVEQISSPRPGGASRANGGLSRVARLAHGHDPASARHYLASRPVERLPSAPAAFLSAWPASAATIRASLAS